ncbi:MAG: ral secretion pathway protein [Sphingomonadales bacterium]|jgi:general secretion pathway protein C|nr:ral secretion pathway protein [Sphingomonadales bacterium]
MRLAFDSRRLIGRARGVNGWTVLEIAFLAFLSLQCARLIWTVATPVGPLGDWRSEPVPGGEASAAALGGFDPFFRLSGAAGPVTVTSLNLKLFGVRQDQASGRGSAIIAGSDGQQRSIAVGEEVEPGVTLKSVDFDSVTISRGGADEQLFMDQSQAPNMVAPGGASSPTPTAPVASQSLSLPPAPPPPPPPSRPQPAEVSAVPRMNGSQLTGVTVQPRGTGEGFRALGLAPGDVVVSVNGRRIRSAEQAQGMADQLASARVTLQVERGGRVVTLRPGDAR